MPVMNPWDERYNSDDYAYGTVANDFLVSVSDRIPKSRVLCVAEGEGRNAVFLAERGYAVTAVDSSSVGLQKAKQLAAQRGVAIETHCMDLKDWIIEPNQWNAIIAIFAHVPPEVRVPMHQAAVRGLVPGGAFVLEAYTADQLQYKSGGPSVPHLLMDLAILREELEGLEWAIAHTQTREIHEGRLHKGMSAVVQMLGFKPE